MAEWWSLEKSSVKTATEISLKRFSRMNRGMIRGLQNLYRIFSYRFCARFARRSQGLAKSGASPFTTHDTPPLGRTASTHSFSKTGGRILPKLAEQLGMIMNSARGGFYPIRLRGLSRNRRASDRRRGQNSRIWLVGLEQK